MLARTLIESPLSVQYTRLSFATFVIAALVALSVIIALEISTAAARSTIGPAEQSSAPTVDRTRKANRLMLAPAVQPNREMQRPEIRQPTADPKLVAGCESSVSPLARTKWSTIAARCVS